MFKSYDVCRDDDDEPLYTRTYTIVGITPATSVMSLLTDEEFKFIRQYDVYTFGLYFTNADACADIYYLTDGTEFYTANQSLEAIYKVVEVVEIFKEYFDLIGVLIAAVGFLLLVSYHSGNIKSRRYEIGVLRSLGAKTGDISAIFFMQSLLIGILTTAVFVAGIFALTDTVNNILIDSFKSYINSPAMAFIDGITILDISLSAIITDILLLLLISALSSVIPFAAIRKIKPISIVRSRE